MADFRRSIPVLAVLALLLGSAVTASAQNPALQCFANAAVPPIVRAEGITELVGDLLLNCTGGTPTALGAQIPPVNIQIFLNTSVTSRVLSTTGGTWLESVLLLDEPRPGFQYPCELASGVCTGLGNGTGTPNYYGGSSSGTLGNNKNAFQGQLIGTNSVLWLGVPIDPPGSNQTRVIRITNIRGNANALGLASGNSIPTPIIESITATGTQSVPINNPQQTVAAIHKGLLFTMGSNATTTSAFTVGSVQQCNGISGRAIGTMRWQELFATAFKKRNNNSSVANPSSTVVAPAEQNNLVTGAALNTETGFYSQALAVFSRGSSIPAGVPDFGTRLKAVFNNIPAGVTLSVDATMGSTSGLQLINTSLQRDAGALTATEAGTYSALAGASSAVTGGAGVPVGGVIGTVTANSATFVYEVLESDALSFTTLSANVYASYTAAPGSNSPALGTTTVNGSYAPISTATTATTGPIPRFADTSTANNIFTIVPCTTNLLFPFVTNKFGFDTGLAISNTSTDPFGTVAQSGTCSLNWYGDTAPAATTTPVIATGTAYTTTALASAPGFQGYMIAVCRFQYAHGFAFVTKVGATDLAMGYLALIIPDPARGAFPFPCAGGATIAGCVSSGEQLGF
ncbi:MAG: hypothetical protein ABIZ80_05400 [Bryobacteraceae bacterium]